MTPQEQIFEVFCSQFYHCGKLGHLRPNSPRRKRRRVNNDPDNSSERNVTPLKEQGNKKEHLKHLSKLLDAIAEEGFRLKLTKCKFAAQSVRFLGHIVEGNTITPLKDNLRSIAEFPAPQNKKQIRQFLGKDSGSSARAAPITSLLPAGPSFRRYFIGRMASLIKPYKGPNRV
ncbi:hypothetical protein EVAR_43977_1 [Eumeta japonica]|uniref:Uncharacterized protein n=1 Tax=Eumeta variegata TaxID=151549 RepID=A0A4C1XH27_EUMVA|nr:hypothetical protein EVAR_43977_1 [Eumeta japonica]